jgi:hypothetical protein
MKGPYSVKLTGMESYILAEYTYFPDAIFAAMQKSKALKIVWWRYEENDILQQTSIGGNLYEQILQKFN